MMKSYRLLAYLIGCGALAASFLIYMEYVYMLGFPDGFITELEQAQRRLAYIFIGISVISGLCFICLGWAASRKKIGKKLFAAIIVYLVSIITLSLIDYYYRLHLMDGTGG
jgi:hypothetical protein